MDNFFSNTILLPFVTAFIVTCIATPISIFSLKKAGVVDDPKRKHPGIIHTKPIPRGGGIPLFIGALVAGFLFLPLNKYVGTMFLASFIALVIGVLDDKFDLSPYIRLVMNFICAMMIVVIGINVPFITNPLGGILYLNQFKLGFDVLGYHGIIFLSQIVTLIWVVGIMNMLNWSKGVDGQMPGIVAISAIVIGILSLRFGIFDESSQIATILSFIIAGSALGFLIFNFYPAKIFPGYGATSIYLLLSSVAILSSSKLATAILVMGIPLADGAYTIARRILTGHSPFWHDKKHFHHLLLSAGFGQRRIALFYWVFSAILGALSLVLSSKGKLFAIILLIVLLGGALLFLNYFIRNKNDKEIL